MNNISINDTQYVSNYNCSYCGSVKIQYKAKTDTTLMKEIYPYLCARCWTKMPRVLSTEFYEKI